MECNNERANELLRVVNVEESEPLETYRTILEENCFAQAKIFKFGDGFLVYMRDEERLCVELAKTIDEARVIARKFTDSVCGDAH